MESNSEQNNEWEINWMLLKRPLIFSESQLTIDYGTDVANQIKVGMMSRGKEFASKFLPTFAWHGVGTRWKSFIEFLDEYVKSQLAIK